MLFEKLIKNAGLNIVSKGGPGNPEISDICYDSRRVSNGALYAAIPGTKMHGDNFIADALAKGAVAVISENPQPGVNAPWIQIQNVRAMIGKLGAALWNVDTKNLFLIGITGTNGKTTTAHLYHKLLEQRFSLEKTWMFGTINYHLGSTTVPADHTTPEALEILRFIGTREPKPEGLAMEVSSHSLALDRIGGLAYDVAIWTNLTQDHLDFHKTMESYYLAKKRLFTEYLKKNGRAIVNCDDPWGRRLIGELDSESVVGYGRAADAQIRITGWNCDWEGCRIELDAFGKKMSFHSLLRGFFNVYNMTALTAGALSSGFSEEEIHQTFMSITTVPGRMDRVELDAPYAVIVDYAHTPDALLNILSTARPLTSGKLICVFGCGGDRDKTKRPLMGKIVAENSDEAVVTSDNPRSEEPMAIIDEILGGIPLDFPHRIAADRRDAVRIALESAKPGDCIVIAGKGHEDYQEIKGVKRHFDDKEVVRQLCAQMKKEKNETRS